MVREHGNYWETLDELKPMEKVKIFDEGEQNCEVDPHKPPHKSGPPIPSDGADKPWPTPDKGDKHE